MYKLLLASIMSLILLNANNIDLKLNDKKNTEPNVCEKIYNDCTHECEIKTSQQSFPSCLINCTQILDNCKNEKNADCIGLYSTCSKECEEIISESSLNECFTNCEVLYDKCEDK